MATYHVNYNELQNQAASLQNMGKTLASLESRLNTIAKGMDSRDTSMAALKLQVMQCGKTVPALATKVSASGSTLGGIVSTYKGAEQKEYNALADLVAFLARLGIPDGVAVGGLLGWWIANHNPNKPPFGIAGLIAGVLNGGNANTGTASSGNMKPYTGSASDFHNYSVVSGFDEAYRYNQYHYDRIFFDHNRGKNVGCTATAEAIVVSIARGYEVKPDEMSFGVSNSDSRYLTAKWAHSKDVYPTKESDMYRHGTADERLNLIYEQLTQGNAVIVRANDRHTVAAVGIMNGKAPPDLEASHIMIIDPADGEIKSLDKAWPLVDGVLFGWTAPDPGNPEGNHTIKIAR